MLIQLKNAFNAFADLIYPNKCIFCDEVIGAGKDESVCKYCETDLKYILNDKEPNLSTLYYDDKVKSSIHRFKYYNCANYSKGFSQLMYKKFINNTKEKYDLIVYVPMFYKKKKKRGYDQSELLAIEFSKISKIPVELNNLIRIKNTLPQSKIDISHREENVKGAFKVLNPPNLQGKNIILIDDIFTTGNTIFQCSKELKASGVNNICFLTLSKVSTIPS